MARFCTVADADHVPFCREQYTEDEIIRISGQVASACAGDWPKGNVLSKTYALGQETKSFFFFPPFTELLATDRMSNMRPGLGGPC